MRQLNTPFAAAAAAAIRPAPPPARALWRQRLLSARALPRPLARWTPDSSAEQPDLAQRVRESGEW